jgi:hypothetical protein
MTLKKRLCERCCPHFKPGKNNELSCKGYSIIEKLLQEGRDIHFQRSDRVLAETTEQVLTRYMCVACPFYKEDCDFIRHEKDSPPCGGFTLLGHLLESRDISISDIIRNISPHPSP